MPALFRRRQVWLPTWWGALVMLTVLGLVAGGLAVNAYALLSPAQPARGLDGHGARTLVIEGWMPEAELIQAIPVIRAGRYERVLTTGGPMEPSLDVGNWRTLAVHAAAVLRAKGVTEPPVIAVSSTSLRRDRTYQMAVAVREWAKGNGVDLDAIDLFSVGAHTRRSRMGYRLALGRAVEVGTFVAVPTEYDPQRWWSSSEGVKATMDEVFGLAWMSCCLWP